jgi:hypothetical protein
LIVASYALYGDLQPAGVGCWKIRGSSYYWYLLAWFIAPPLVADAQLIDEGSA